MTTVDIGSLLAHMPAFTQLIYTAAEMADLLADSTGKWVVSPDWLSRNAASGSIPCSPIGRFIRFSPADIVEFIRSGCQPPGTYGRSRP